MDSFVARSAAAWSEHWMPFVTGGAFMLVFAFSNGCAGPTFCLVGLWSCVFVPYISPQKAVRWILAGAGIGSAGHAYWQASRWVAFLYPFRSAYHMHVSHSTFSWGSWCSSCMSSWTSPETHCLPWSGPSRGTQLRNYKRLTPTTVWVSYGGTVCGQPHLCCQWPWSWTRIPLPSGD